MKKYQLTIACSPDKEVWERVLGEKHGKPIHHYLAVGIENKRGFTGWAMNYVDGGRFKDAFFLHNLQIDKDEEREAMEAIDQTYPGLLATVMKTVDKLATFNPEHGRYFAPRNFAKQVVGRQGQGEFFFQGKPFKHLPVVQD